ncbi:hypothetical protein [Aquabacterium sp.]|uniref:hypothetical protein n=1 Tax=Aquabacterium sp. TaxID=1872578 RepID=UPI0025C15F3F|nr:hypothetical protein [Aquabacterium sp.]
MTTSLSTVLGGNPPLWVSGRTYGQWQIVRSPADYQLYVRITAAGSGATDPSADAVNYLPAGGRAPKSNQRGTITIASGAASATATVTAVVTGKSRLRRLGYTFNGAGDQQVVPRLALTNTTTITATRNGTTGDTVVSWELTEYF